MRATGWTSGSCWSTAIRCWTATCRAAGRRGAGRPGRARAAGAARGCPTPRATASWNSTATRSRAFRERPARPARPGTINAGIYVLRPPVLDDIAAGLLAGARRAAAPGRRAARCAAPCVDGWFIDIGVPDDLARAQAELPRAAAPPGAVPGPRRRAQPRSRLCRQPRALPLDRRARRRRSALPPTPAGMCSSSPTSPAWRAACTTRRRANLHAWMADEVRRAGGTIDDFRYCPYPSRGGAARRIAAPATGASRRRA